MNPYEGADPESKRIVENVVWYAKSDLRVLVDSYVYIEVNAHTRTVIEALVGLDGRC